MVLYTLYKIPVKELSITTQSCTVRSWAQMS